MSIQTPEQIATDALTGYAPGADVSREDVWQLVRDAITADRDAPTPGFIVFTGTYEVWHDYEQAEKRIEELLDEGHTSPTVVKVELTQDDGSDVLGITARKIAGTSKAGEIR